MKIILYITLRHLKQARYAMKKLVDAKLVNDLYYKSICRVIDDIEGDFDIKQK